MTAELFYIYPGEGLPLTEGSLITENGEEVEGIWLTKVFPDGDDGGRPGAVQVQFTMMVRALPPLPEDVVAKAVQSMLEIHQTTGSGFEPKETTHESNEIRDR